MYGKKPRESDFKIFMGLKNITFDVCKLNSGKMQSFFYDMMLAGARKYTNTMHPCPYTVSGNIAISVRKVSQRICP